MASSEKPSPSFRAWHRMEHMAMDFSKVKLNKLIIVAQSPATHVVIKLNKYYSVKKHDLLQEHSSVIRKGDLK